MIGKYYKRHVLSNPLLPGNYLYILANCNAVLFGTCNNPKGNGEDVKQGPGLDDGASRPGDGAVPGISVWGEICIRGRGLDRA